MLEIFSIALYLYLAFPDRFDYIFIRCDNCFCPYYFWAKPPPLSPNVSIFYLLFKVRFVPIRLEFYREKHVLISAVMSFVYPMYVFVCSTESVFVIHQRFNTSLV